MISFDTFKRAGVFSAAPAIVFIASYLLIGWRGDFELTPFLKDLFVLAVGISMVIIGAALGFSLFSRRLPSIGSTLLAGNMYGGCSIYYLFIFKLTLGSWGVIAWLFLGSAFFTAFLSIINNAFNRR